MLQYQNCISRYLDTPLDSLDARDALGTNDQDTLEIRIATASASGLCRISEVFHIYELKVFRTSRASRVFRICISI